MIAHSTDVLIERRYFRLERGGARPPSTGTLMFSDIRAEVSS